MSNTVVWYPSTDANILNYDVARSNSMSGPWTPLVTVTHTIPGANYNGSTGQFFYIDAAGGATDWYRLIARDTAAQVSDPSVFQTGNAYPTSPKWTTSELIPSVKRRGMIPTAQSTFSDTDFLRLADEEVETTIVPLVASAREDYWAVAKDYSPSATKTVRIPQRAIGTKVRNVILLDSAGSEVPCPRISPADAGSATHPCFYVASSSLVLVNPTSAVYPTMRVWFYLRPNRLVTVAEVAQITGFIAATKQVTVNILPTVFTSGLRYDLVKSSPGFETVSMDNAAATISGSVITFTDALPESLEVGDHVCRAGETAIPQVPLEFHPVLAQLVAAKCLDALGDVEQSGSAMGRALKMADQALGLVSTRVDAGPLVAVPGAPWRRR